MGGYRLILAIATLLLIGESFAQNLPIDLDGGWVLSWSDEFDYPNEQLDERWTSQNNSSGGMVMCSRWRDNVEVHDDILEITIRKENRAGQEWSAGSIWTKEQFHYGYYECRYKYAGATGTNNSFWMWPVGGVKEGEKKYELDVNEGHYPATINTNFHNWSDKYEDGSHDTWPQVHNMGKGGKIESAYSHQFQEGEIKAYKIRFSSTSLYPFTMGEFSIYAPSESGYPEDPTDYEAIAQTKGLVNLAQATTTTLTTSRGKEVDGLPSDHRNLIDGKGRAWLAPGEGEKWIEFDFGSAQDIGCIQFTNGWNHKGNLKGVVHDYKIEYYDGNKWCEATTRNYYGGVDLSEEYHTYGMLWDQEKISYYFDGELLRTHYHSDIISPTNIYLSLAILTQEYAGAVTDQLDGKSMKVDYVRYYEYKSRE
ncbi:MAG: family 16 glycosylhydrolase [Rikenellaceae bacterium]